MPIWIRIKYAWLAFRYPRSMAASITVVRAALHGEAECTLDYYSTDGKSKATFHVEIREVAPLDW